MAGRSCSGGQLERIRFCNPLCQQYKTGQIKDLIAYPAPQSEFCPAPLILTRRMMDYWKLCVEEAFDDAGIKASDEQISTVISWVESAHENFSQAMGYDVIKSNFISQEKRELTELKAQIKKREDWESRTKPCRDCFTTGSVKDGWGRDVTCIACDGKGRVPHRW